MDQLEQMFQDRVTSALSELEAATKQAESVKDQGKDAARYARAFDDALTLTNLDTDNLPALGGVIEYLTMTRDALRAESGIDRSEGDRLAANLQGMLQSGITVADEIKAKVESAVEAWRKSGGKVAKAGGPRAAAGQGKGINVELKCSCGWVQHDSNNPNSARWAILKHLRDNTQSHPSITTAPGGRMRKDGTFTDDTSPDWAKVTKAVYPVASGEQASAQTEAISDGSVFTVMVA